ncbi:MAG: asparagine synthase (glutamine-hydrolyzing) [Thermodesulfobacteriota bacterium]|nr:asparagine synthase (glutamine-hydrolyzing) [Thermodesulfobacteriota bacterium]
MCGIHGIFSNSYSKEEIARRLIEMGRIQRHRGPDDQEEAVYPAEGGWLGFGFVRLSILDLETGMQPIQCPKDQSAIVCNGQIYNYLELRSEISRESFVSKTDIEIALHLYRLHGLSFIHRLNGMYAGAIFDPLRRKLLLFRDRFGIKPLYYTISDGDFLFSSEIKPLLEVSGLPRRLNESRLATLFSYRYLPGEETMFLGIKRLPPGSFLEYDLPSRSFRVERYWEYRFNSENLLLNLDEASDQFNELFADAVRIRLRSDVEVGSLLSSGIDSSAVASQAARHKPGLRMFTISFPEGRYNELRQVERFIRTNRERFDPLRHYSISCESEILNELPDIIRALEEPIFLGAVLPTDQICRMSGDYLKVVLSGEGADEIFAGYRKFLIEMAAHQYPDMSPEWKRHICHLYPEIPPYITIRHSDPVRRYIQSEQLFSHAELKRLLGIETLSDLFPEDALPTLDGSEHPLNAALAMESRFRLPDYVVLRLDRLSMRHSLETRTPFLDYRLAEFAATLPVNFKVNLEMNQEKFICRHSFVKHQVLDQETASRRKMPFTSPLSEWLSKPAALPGFLQDILFGDTVEKQGLLSAPMVKELAAKVSPKDAGPTTLVSDADRVFAVIVFSMWYHEFFN